MGRRIFSRFTVNENISVEVSAHHINNVRQWLLRSGDTAIYRKHSHSTRLIHPFAIGSAEVSSPQTANIGVIAKMSAALPATITSSEMTVHTRKMRMSARHAET